jgi:hypothetical protein
MLQSLLHRAAANDDGEGKMLESEEIAKNANISEIRKCNYFTLWEDAKEENEKPF